MVIYVVNQENQNAIRPRPQREKEPELGKERKNLVSQITRSRSIRERKEDGPWQHALPLCLNCFRWLVDFSIDFLRPWKKGMTTTWKYYPSLVNVWWRPSQHQNRWQPRQESRERELSRWVYRFVDVSSDHFLTIQFRVNNYVDISLQHQTHHHHPCQVMDILLRQAINHWRFKQSTSTLWASWMRHQNIPKVKGFFPFECPYYRHPTCPPHLLQIMLRQTGQVFKLHRYLFMENRKLTNRFHYLWISLANCQRQLTVNVKHLLTTKPRNL